MERLCAAVGDHKCARVDRVDEGAVQRDRAATRVCHFCLISVWRCCWVDKEEKRGWSFFWTGGMRVSIIHENSNTHRKKGECT